MQDSGANGYFVNYVSYDAEPASIHGGTALSSWSLYDSTKNIWAAPVAPGTRHVYINGKRPSRVQTGAGLQGTVSVTAWGYTTTDTSMVTWAATSGQNVADFEFLYTGIGSSWTESRCRVLAVSALQTGGANITMQQPCWSLGVNKPFGQGIGANCANIENVLAMLSNPGEHYINSDAGVVYYIPLSGEQMPPLSAFTAVTEVLVTMTGDRYHEPLVAPVHHITLQNLLFQYATWLEPSQSGGYIDMQSGFRISQVIQTQPTIPTGRQFPGTCNCTQCKM
jgi:hypothetical protein